MADFRQRALGENEPVHIATRFQAHHRIMAYLARDPAGRDSRGRLRKPSMISRESPPASWRPPASTGTPTASSSTAPAAPSAARAAARCASRFTAARSATGRITNMSWPTSWGRIGDIGVFIEAPGLTIRSRAVRLISWFRAPKGGGSVPDLLVAATPRWAWPEISLANPRLWCRRPACIWPGRSPFRSGKPRDNQLAIGTLGLTLLTDDDAQRARTPRRAGHPCPSSPHAPCRHHRRYRPGRRRRCRSSRMRAGQAWFSRWRHRRSSGQPGPLLQEYPSSDDDS